jgi:peptidoglycan/LPS O-acetylase OafA/YrhL
LLKAFGSVPFADVFAFGHTGVDFFFVLSGFIICHIHAADIGRPAALGRYFQRRFARIYPFYWVVVGVCLLLVLVRHHPPTLMDLVTSVLLAPLPGDLLVPVAWSLQHEVVFYAFFGMLIIHRNFGFALLGAWLALIAYGFFAIDNAPTSGVMITVFDAEFFLGMFAAYLLRRVAVPYPRTLLWLGMAAFFGLGAAEDLHFVRPLASPTHLGYGIAAMVIVLGVVGAERQGKLRAPRLLTVLGNASYALYLTHLLTVGAIWQVLLATGLAQTLPTWTQFVMFVAGAVAVGVAASRTVELPVTAFTRRLLAPLFNRRIQAVG